MSKSLEQFAAEQEATELPASIRKALVRGPASLDELAEALHMNQKGRKAIKRVLDGFIADGLHIEVRGDGRYVLAKDIEPGGHSKLRLSDRGDGWSALGFTSDNHLGSKHERLDVLNSLYDIFAQEGVKDVYNGGNWIEGEMRLNRHDIKIFGLDNQVDYFIQNFPQRKGITTHYVAGDDHEGWYVQRESIDIGRYVQNAAERAGRHDLDYLGYVEADIALTTKGGASVPMRVIHGGGGSTYAYSYVLQKTVEAFQGGEKPAILCAGHYHKFDYCYPRNVHAFMPGCTEDQSIFMRKRKIEAHVGGVIAWIQQDQVDGHIKRFRAEWIPFYDLGYYERRFKIGAR